jgi:dephospho-CoA kinase
MIILGLTGSIGMGKSEASRGFRRLGIPVFDSDAAVHKVMRRNGRAVPRIAMEFPDVVTDGTIDRQALGRHVFANPASLRLLESIVHPMVRDERDRFLKRMRARRQPLVVLDVPLLFEGGGDKSCDYTAVVSAPHRVQRTRVMARAGMTAEKFAGILRQQMPDGEKRRRADFVIPTGGSRGQSLRVIRGLVRMLRNAPRRRRRHTPHG